MKKTIITLMLLALIIVSFTACGNVGQSNGSIPPGPHSLVVVVQKTANSPDPMLTSSWVSNTIYCAAMNDKSSVTLIEADGSAYTLDTLSISVKSNISDAKKDSLAKQVTSKVINIAKTAQPKTEEVDTLKSLHHAARNIDASAPAKTIIYLGSALQTTGELSFADQNYFDADIDSIIEKLKDIKAIPEFPSGTKVIFAGVGDVIEPQPELTYEYISTLKEIWKRICEEGGAEVDFITATPTTETDTSSYPKVSTVSIIKKITKS